MAVAEHQHLQQVAERILLFLGHVGKQFRHLVVNELRERVVDLCLLLFKAAEVEVRFERGFEVEGHRAEASSFEVKVKLLVLLGMDVQHHIGTKLGRSNLRKLIVAIRMVFSALALLLSEGLIFAYGFALLTRRLVLDGRRDFKGAANGFFRDSVDLT